MPSTQKDTIYIDVDDEITSIIDKLKSSDQKIVALVLPKRAAVLQSVVNMKLLKRTADQAKKHVVLITSETGLLPLAGAVGMHVASSLQSKPAIPAAPAGIAAVSTEDAFDFDPEASADQPVGELAPSAAFAPADDELETIQLDDEPTADTDPEAVAPAAGASAAALVGTEAKKPKKNSKLSVPDFNRFRLFIILGICLLVGLAVFAYFAVAVLPKATVTIKTDSLDIPTNQNITLDPTQTELDLDNKVLPAKIASKQQTATQQTVATGQKNNGTKATGTVTMTAQECGAIQPADDVPAGTGISANGKTYITQGNTSFSAFGKPVNGCINFKADNDTQITAQSPGAGYNIDPTTFAVAGRKDVTAKSSDAISGGTDNIIKVVTQSDINTAKQKLTTSTGTSSKSDLQSQLSTDGYTAVAASLKSGDPNITTSANPGDQADTVTVTSTTTNTMYGYKKEDLQNLILANVKDKINPSKQKILDDGSGKPTFTITSPASSGQLQATLSATSLAGPDLKTDQLKSQIAGKKTNDVRTAAKATPGVTDVSVNYSPFWVSSVPKNPAKITIVIEKASASTNGNQ